MNIVTSHLKATPWQFSPRTRILVGGMRKEACLMQSKHHSGWTRLYPLRHLKYTLNHMLQLRVHYYQGVCHTMLRLRLLNNFG